MRNWSLLGFSISLFHSCVFSIGNGVNLQPSYYNNGNVTFGWELMKSYPQIKSVRIEIEPDKVTQGKQWIDQARSNGYEIIATFHNYNVLGSDDSNELLNAANWWKQNYAYLSNGGPITVNIMNEWGSHNQDMYSYSNAYNQAISIIRSVYSGYLILDIPGWGQETLTASKASPLINDKNIIFSAHVYSRFRNIVLTIVLTYHGIIFFYLCVVCFI
jgi:mannan endo-1,4-beta-mannosidase